MVIIDSWDLININHYFYGDRLGTFHFLLPKKIEGTSMDDKLYLTEGIFLLGKCST